MSHLHTVRTVQGGEEIMGRVTMPVNRRPTYRVLQPWGPDKGRQAMLLSEHATVPEAFAAIDAVRAQMVRTRRRVMRST